MSQGFSGGHHNSCGGSGGGLGKGSKAETHILSARLVTLLARSVQNSMTQSIEEHTELAKITALVKTVPEKVSPLK